MATTPLRLTRLALSLCMALAVSGPALAAQLPGQAEATARLAAATGQRAEVSIHPATGTARFVRVAPGAVLAAKAVRGTSSQASTTAANQFLGEYAALFGITDPATELGAARVTRDRLGHVRVAQKQLYNGLPVFGAELLSHFDANGNLIAVSGAFVPGIDVLPYATKTAQQAGDAAIARVRANLNRFTLPLQAGTPTLMVFREGLAKGQPGANRLTWQVVVGNGMDVREFVYVDAHSGKVIEQISGIHTAKNRRAFDAAGATAPGSNYPGTPFWVEGQPFPTGNAEADNMIAASGEIYDMFRLAFGRDSYNGAGATMDSIFNRGNGCPNASWNGTFISFCPGLTTDDVTAHEWGHAYTEYTHNLIYQWQPGALNESYSDIWGETVDRLNGRGVDTPNAPRTAGACTAFTPNLPTVTVNTPAALAGALTTGTASFGAQTFNLTNNVGLIKNAALSGVGDACAAVPNPADVSGRIAYVDRGTCSFIIKAKNAQNAGALALVIGNNTGGTVAQSMSGTDATVTIPVLSVSQNDGTAVKAQLMAGTTVNATMTRGGVGTDNSVRWLMGEEASGFGGAIRDMYNPTCYSNPGKVSDRQYVCSTDDGGGVHTNSGVPNHAYALLVDGGTYNGRTVNAIGLTKAAHIYYRAQLVYQGPSSDFAAHADAIEQSCRDLTGANLTSLSTGAPSGEVITATDCQQVATAAAAVELRTPPSQCNFVPLLAQNPPALCPSGTPTTLLADSFDGGRRGGVAWTVSATNASSVNGRRNWGVTGALPGGRTGYAMYASDPDSSCSGADASSVVRMESPEFTVPAGANLLRMAFDHWVATESGYDGGNIKISVNGGAWTTVAAADFIYNPYNTTLTASGSTNPLAGQPAFSGTDGGSVSGSWGRSIINLAPYAAPGARVKLRFEMGTDNCAGLTGWYVDDVKVYRCNMPL